jgi:hypothetical protein
MSGKMMFSLFISIGILFLASCSPGQARPSPAATQPTIEATPLATASLPMASPTALSTGLVPTATTELGSDGWKVYRNEELGYSFHYPAAALIIKNDDPLGGLSIIGPTTSSEHWPIFSISHPRDREEYRPPAGVDLEKWLVDHYLTGEKRMPDRQIAGTTAIHYRHERSPQSYADDRYFFAKDGQLYQILIGHAGDKEDWEVYNHFLDSFQFEE